MEKSKKIRSRTSNKFLGGIIKIEMIAAALHVAALIYLVHYISRTTINILYQDYMNKYFVDLIENYENGNIHLSDFLKIYNGSWHGFGSLLFILDLSLFRLNTHFFMALGIIGQVSGCYIITRYVWGKYRSTTNKYYLFLFGVVAPLIVATSLTQWENIVFNGGSLHMLGILPLYASFVYFDKNIRSQNRKLSFSIMFPIISIFIQAPLLQYYLGFVAAVCFCMVTFIIFSRKNNSQSSTKETIYTQCPIFLSVFIGALIAVSGSGAVNGGIFNVLSQNSFGHIFGFFLITLASSALGCDASGNAINAPLFLYGIAFFALYAVAIFIFFYRGIYKSTYLPLLLMVFSLTISAMITIGRLNSGYDVAMSSRYTTFTGVGHVGIILAFLVAGFSKETANKVQSRKIPNAIRSVGLVSLIGLCGSHLYTTMIEWKISPYRYANYNQAKQVGLQIDYVTPDTLNMFQESPKNTLLAYQTLRKYKLSMFQNIGTDLSTAEKIGQWYNDGWIGTNARLALRTPVSGLVKISGFAPPQTATTSIQILGNGTLLGNYDIIKGKRFTFVVNAPRDQIVTFDLKPDGYIIPAEIDPSSSSDRRHLSVIITDVREMNDGDNR